MIEKLERTLGEVESDLGQEPETTPESKSTKVRKVAKKAKKVAKKAAKSTAPKKKTNSESDEGKVKLSDLANEAEITTAAARRKLRAAELSREGRWSWEEGSKSLKDARKALGLDA